MDDKFLALVSPNLIGRDEIFGALVQQLERIVKSNHTPPLALVTGETGIGKSRLIGHIEHYAGDNGFSIWHGSCFEQDRSW